MQGAVNPTDASFVAPDVDRKLFIPKMLTYLRAYLGVKITIMCAHPAPQSFYFPCPMGPIVVLCAL